MVVNVRLASTSATVGTVPVFPSYIGNVDQSTTSTVSISGIANASTGVYTKYTYEYVNQAGTVQTVGAAAQNYVRYAEYPGERIFKKVRFDVNGERIAIKSAHKNVR